MPMIEYFLGFIITVLVVALIYKDGKEKEAIHNSEFLSAEILQLNILLHQKKEEIKKLKENQKEEEIKEDNKEEDVEVL